ncbi:mandelate racemase/muconate lactonizing enzyme family protein (plasmid) [Agrobacterium salinitolerans]|uniref:mandelate racemase/muconate lactonizing enzyme family protein n=1 Tax=Agrobacterium salinitolerans TaxID=1183413 RepID=UPI000DD05642|nr:mandelate racemase/muconate lactonizing enzyme family protein [Agrobacterium salinitolerans]QXC52325.1 mandelate racemase/muconate lactonizing enzyme family protein [Agrobacterium salinitolerans]
MSTIIKIKGYHLRFRPQPALGNARTFIREREFLVVEVTTGNGLSGWGEVFSSPYGAAALIRHRLAPKILGEDPQEFGRIYAEMVKLQGYDRRGAHPMAVSAIDMALHDLAARERQTSVSAMLGGALRTTIPAYASGPFMLEGDAPYRDFPDEVEKLARQGFRAVKPRVGLSPKADGEIINRLRKQVGQDIALMVDINQGYTVNAAIESAKRMEEAGLMWIEEPVQPEDIQGYKKVVGASVSAIAGGEAIASPAGFRDFLVEGALSIVQPDMTVCGGFSGYQRVAALASAFDVPTMPHVFSTVINLHAAIQMAALLPAWHAGGLSPYPYVEFDTSGNPLMELYGNPVSGEGFLDLPDGHGIGIDIKADDFADWIVDHWSVER